MGVTTTSWDGNAHVDIKEIIRFSQFTQEYQTILPQESSCPKCIHSLQKMVQNELNQSGYTDTIEVTLLSENDKSNGTDTRGSLCTIFSLLVHVLLNKVSIDLVADIAAFAESKEFASVYALATKFIQELDVDVIGTTAYAMMMPIWLPVIGSLDDNMIKIDAKDTPCIWGNISLEDYFHIKKHKGEFHKIDYGTIYFWLWSDESFSEDIYNNVKNSFSNTYNLSKKSALTKDSDPFSNIVDYLNLKILLTWKEMFQNPGDEFLVDKFIDVMMDHGLFTALIEKEKKSFIDTFFLFEKTKHFPNEKIGLLPISNNKLWGGFVFFTHYQRSRETMENLIWALQENWHKKVCYPYLSWVDGLSDDTLKVEQFLDKNIYSSYIKKDSVMLQNCEGQKNLCNYADILENLPEGLIFDTLSGKIFINGMQATHKDLFTQSWTVEIFNVLLQHIGQNVNNTDLPSSGYSKNKNEMTGKILLPLQQLVQKHFKQKLNLKCTWSIVDFDIMIDTCSIPVYIIKRIR